MATGCDFTSLSPGYDHSMHYLRHMQVDEHHMVNIVQANQCGYDCNQVLYKEAVYILSVLL